MYSHSSHSVSLSSGSDSLVKSADTLISESLIRRASSPMSPAVRLFARPAKPGLLAWPVRRLVWCHQFVESQLRRSLILF